MPHRTPRFAALVLATSVAAGTILCVALLRQPPADLPGPHPALFAVFATCLLVAEIRPVYWLRYANTDVSLSWVFALSLLLLGATSGAIAVLAVAAAVGNRVAGMDVVRNAFNTSQMILSLAAGAVVLHVVVAGDAAVTSTSTIDERWLAAVLLASIAIYVVNAFLVATAISTARGGSIATHFVDGIRTNLSGDGLILALAPIAVQAGVRSRWLLLPLILTGLGTYRVARLAGSREYEATHDELTGLANRRRFNEELEGACERLGTGSIAVVIVDLDRFKQINDTHGHPAGDHVLREQARRLVETFPSRATIARLGGDEFAVVCPVSSSDEARLLADSAARHLGEPISVDGRSIEVGASVGVALGNAEGWASPAELLSEADEAMYVAKRSRDRAVIAEPAVVGHPDHATRS